MGLKGSNTVVLALEDISMTSKHGKPEGIRGLWDLCNINTLSLQLHTSTLYTHEPAGTLLLHGINQETV